MVFSVNTVMNAIWGLFYTFLQDIMKDMATLLGDITAGFGGGLGNAFNAWGSSFNKYGIWALAMLVISIMIALIIAYLFFMILAPEKQIAEEEEEL